MSDISFVRTEMLPQKDPPASAVGVVGWMRANLFSGWFNTVLTLISLYFVIQLLMGLFHWAWVPTWSAASLPECRDIFEQLGRSGHNVGACWGVIAERWPQLLFGFYPNGSEPGTADLRWRPILAFALLFVALAPVLFSEKVPAKLIYFTALYPFIMPWLLWGGTVWTPVSAALGFVLGYVVYKALAQSASELIGLIVGVVAAVLWWLFVASLFSSALASVIPLALETVESRQFGGFMLSITIGVVAIGLSLPIGIVLALGRQSDLLIVKTLCVGFIEFIRGCR